MSDEKKQNNQEGGMEMPAQIKPVEEKASRLETEIFTIIEEYGGKIKEKVEGLNELFNEVGALRQQLKELSGEEVKDVEKTEKEAREKLKDLEIRFNTALAECADFVAAEEIKKAEAVEPVKVEAEPEPEPVEEKVEEKPEPVVEKQEEPVVEEQEETVVEEKPELSQEQENLLNKINKLRAKNIEDTNRHLNTAEKKVRSGDLEGAQKKINFIEKFIDKKLAKKKEDEEKKKKKIEAKKENVRAVSEKPEALKGSIKGLEKLKGMVLSDQKDKEPEEESAVETQEEPKAEKPAVKEIVKEPEEKKEEPAGRQFPTGRLEVGPYLDMVINEVEKSDAKVKSDAAIDLIEGDFSKADDDFRKNIDPEIVKIKLKELEDGEYKTAGQFKEAAKGILKEIIENEKIGEESEEEPKEEKRETLKMGGEEIAPGVIRRKKEAKVESEEKEENEEEGLLSSDYLGDIIRDSKGSDEAKENIIKEIGENKEFKKWLGKKEFSKLTKEIKAIKKRGKTKKEKQENFYNDLQDLLQPLSEKFLGVDLAKDLDVQKEKIKELFNSPRPREEIIDLLRKAQKKGRLSEETLEFAEESLGAKDKKLGASDADDFYEIVKHLVGELRGIDRPKSPTAHKEKEDFFENLDVPKTPEIETLGFEYNEELDDLVASLEELIRNTKGRGLKGKAEKLLSEMESLKNDSVFITNEEEFKKELKKFEKKVNPLLAAYQKEKDKKKIASKEEGKSARADMRVKIKEELNRVMNSRNIRNEIPLLEKYAEGVNTPERAENYPDWKDEDFKDLLIDLEARGAFLLVHTPEEDSFAQREAEGKALLGTNEPADTSNIEVSKIVSEGAAKQAEERLRKVVEEKRKEYVKAKKALEDKSGLISKIGRFFSRKKNTELENNLAKVEAEYKEAKAEYIGAQISRALEEQIALVDEQTLAEVKATGLGEKAWARVRGIYKKLGDMNLESKMKDKPKSWLGKMGARMLSVRTAINASLVGVGFATGGVGFAAAGAARAGMRFVGTSGLSYDLMKNASVATEEKKGLLSDLNAELIKDLHPENVAERMQMIEARCRLDGTTISKSRYSELYNRLQDRLQEIYKEEGYESPDFDKTTEERIKDLNEFFEKSNEDLDKKIKELGKVKTRQQLIALVAGTVSAAGFIGKAFGKAVGGVKEGAKVIKDHIVGHVEHHIAAVAPAPAPEISVSHIPAEEAIHKVDFSHLSPEEAHSQLDTLAGYEVVAGKGEGITHVMYKDILAHPDRLNDYASKIPEVKELLDAHNGNVEELFKSDMDMHNLPSDTRKILFDIYKHDFNDKATNWEDAMHIKEPGKVAVVFDGEKYKLGTLDGSKVDDNLYSYEKHVEMQKLSDEDLKNMAQGQAREMVGNGPDELSVRGRTDLRAIKDYEEANNLTSTESAPQFKPTETVTRVKVPVNLPDEAKFNNLEEMGAAVQKQPVVPAEAAPAASGLGANTTPDAISGADEAAKVEKPSVQAEDISVRDQMLVEKYNSIFDQVKQETSNYLDLNKNALPLDTDSLEFKNTLRQSIKNLAELDPKSPTSLETVRGLSEAEMQTVARDKIMSDISPQARLLFENAPSEDGVALVEGGSHVIKIINPDSGRAYFKYDPDAIFTRDSAGKAVAVIGDMEVPVNFSFNSDGGASMNYL